MGKIDSESYRTYAAAVEQLEDMHIAGIQTHTVSTQLDDWEELGGSGHRRRNHLHHN